MVSALGLKAADFGILKGFTSDPYVEMLCGGQRQQTAVIKRTLTPSWDESKQFHFAEPPETLVFRVLDKDTTTRDDLLGTSVVDLRQLWKACGDGLSSSPPKELKVLRTLLLENGRGEVQVELQVALRLQHENPVRTRIVLQMSSMGISLVDSPEYAQPREVVYFLLQRAHARVNLRKLSSMYTFRLGTARLEATGLGVVLSSTREQLASAGHTTLRVTLHIQIRISSKPVRPNLIPSDRTGI